MSGFGKKYYILYTKNKEGIERLSPNLPKEIKKALGRPYETILSEENARPFDDSRRMEAAKKVIQAQKQLKMLQTLIAKEEKESLQSDRLKRENAEKDAETAAIQEILIDYNPEEIKSLKKKFEESYEGN